MQAENIHFELVSPERKLMSDPAYMIVVPGDEGDFAAMPGSASTLSSLRAGVVKIFWNREDKTPEQIFISAGFVDVTGTQCTILAEQANDVTQFVQADIEKEIENLGVDLNAAADAHAKTAIQEKISIAKAKIEAITGRVVL